MTSEVEKTPRAKRDLDEIAAYLGEDSLEAALRFLNAAEEAFGILAKMPELGAARTFENSSVGSLRMWPIRGFEKCLVFYRPIQKGIEVVRVIHAARDSQRIFESDP